MALSASTEQASTPDARLRRRAAMTESCRAAGWRRSSWMAGAARLCAPLDKRTMPAAPRASAPSTPQPACLVTIMAPPLPRRHTRRSVDGAPAAVPRSLAPVSRQDGAEHLPRRLHQHAALVGVALEQERGELLR